MQIAIQSTGCAIHHRVFVSWGESQGLSSQSKKVETSKQLYLCSAPVASNCFISNEKRNYNAYQSADLFVCVFFVQMPISNKLWIFFLGYLHHSWKNARFGNYTVTITCTTIQLGTWKRLGTEKGEIVYNTTLHAGQSASMLGKGTKLCRLK